MHINIIHENVETTTHTMNAIMTEYSNTPMTALMVDL